MRQEGRVSLSPLQPMIKRDYFSHQICKGNHHFDVI
ncbi:hypothetical protein CPL0016902_CDS0067 [Escherichia phage tunus]